MCWAQSSLEIRDFRHSDLWPNGQLIEKDQQNASCQVATREPKVVLHLVKSKIYSKCHQQQSEGASNSLSQVHQNDLAQDSLHSSHGLNQAPPWTNPTAYSRACSTMTIWIANSALNSHQSSNSVWLSLNLMIQLIKKTLNSAHSMIKTTHLNLMWTSR